VDEFQDTNRAQSELVSIVAEPHRNLTVVGDDDQSIYRFRGAAISNILGFRDRYRSARTIVLRRNYRSRPAILEASSAGRSRSPPASGSRWWRCLPDRSVDGGASANNWLLQFQSDILGIAVERPDMIETTALGAAGLAGIAGGVWQDATEFIGTRQFTRFAPVMPRESAAELLGQWQRAVRAALSWARDSRPPEAKRRAARKSKGKSRAASKSKRTRPVVKSKPRRGRSK